MAVKAYIGHYSYDYVVTNYLNPNLDRRAPWSIQASTVPMSVIMTSYRVWYGLIAPSTISGERSTHGTNVSMSMKSPYG